MIVLARAGDSWRQLVPDAGGCWREERRSLSLGELFGRLLAEHGLTDILITGRTVHELPKPADLGIEAKEVFIAIGDEDRGGRWRVLFHDRTGTAGPRAVTQLSAGALLAHLKRLVPHMDARDPLNNEVLVLVSWNELLQQGGEPVPTLH
jgi:hypothetical protein